MTKNQFVYHLNRWYSYPTTVLGCEPGDIGLGCRWGEGIGKVRSSSRLGREWVLEK